MDQQEEADEIQGELTRAELEAKLKETQERLARYEGYQKLMEETGASQLSITDADAKLMKNKNGFAEADLPRKDLKQYRRQKFLHLLLIRKEHAAGSKQYNLRR